MDVNVDDICTVRRDADVVQQTGGSPIEPDADPCRRAWFACPNCDHGVGCPECQSSRNCGTHWQYLLKNRGTQVSLQCPGCCYVWTVDTAERDGTADQRTDNGDAIVAKLWLGDCPRDVVISPGGDSVYVLTADSVKVIKSRYLSVASIPVGPEPKQLMMSPDGSRLYVTGYGHSLSIIDPIAMTAKNVVVQPSTAAVVSPDGEHIYLAHAEGLDKGNSAIRVIRADGAFVALIAVDRYTTAMALSRDGRWLYLAAAGRDADDCGGTIAVVDTATYETADVIAVDAAPEALALDAEGLLYVVHYNVNSMSLVDPATRCGITVALDDAPMDIVVHPGSQFIYTANLHSVSAINTSTAAIKSLLIGELPRRLCVSVDGRRLYAVDFAHGTIWALDTSDNSVVGTVDVGAHPAASALSPGGDLLYVTDSRDGTLTVVSTAAIGRGARCPHGFPLAPNSSGR